VALAAGPDGLYFSSLYEDSGANGATASGARIYRVRYLNPLAGDYDIDGDVDQSDYAVWRSTVGSNLLLAADGNRNGVVDAADFVIWRKNLNSGAGAGSSAEQPVAIASPRSDTSSPPAPIDVPASMASKSSASARNGLEASRRMLRLQNSDWNLDELQVVVGRLANDRIMYRTPLGRSKPRHSCC
jgi:hypothetical protein